MSKLNPTSLIVSYEWEGRPIGRWVVPGIFRVEDDTDKFEIYTGRKWIVLSGSAGSTATWEGISGDPSVINLSDFTNDAGFMTSSAMLSGNWSWTGVNSFDNELLVNGNNVWHDGRLSQLVPYTGVVNAIPVSGGSESKIIDTRLQGFGFLAIGDIQNNFSVSIGYFDVINIPGGASVDVNKIHQDNRQTYAVYTSTDTSTNINSNGAAIPWNSSIDVSLGSAYSLNTSSHVITLSEPGVYRVMAMVTYSSSTQRVNVGLRIVVNKTVTSARGYGGYLRALEGHDEATTIIEDWVETTSNNEELEIEAIQTAASGICNCISGASRLVIERKR